MAQGDLGIFVVGVGYGCKTEGDAKAGVDRAWGDSIMRVSGASCGAATRRVYAKGDKLGGCDGGDGGDHQGGDGQADLGDGQADLDNDRNADATHGDGDEYGHGEAHADTPGDTTVARRHQRGMQAVWGGAGVRVGE